MRIGERNKKSFSQEERRGNTLILCLAAEVKGTLAGGIKSVTGQPGGLSRRRLLRTSVEDW